MTKTPPKIPGKIRGCISTTIESMCQIFDNSDGPFLRKKFYTPWLITAAVNNFFISS